MQLTPDLQERLSRLAEEQGRDSSSLVIEAVERFLDYDAWFVEEVNKGLAAAYRGKLTNHEEVRAMIDRKFPGWQNPPDHRNAD